MTERYTRKDLVARANKFGLDVETHSPGGSGTYYTFGTPEIFKPPTRTIGRTHTEHGLAKANSFLDVQGGAGLGGEVMSGHTPGPWTWDHNRHRLELVTTAPDQPHNDPVVLAVRHDWVRYLSHAPNGEANARLISASPELLEACELALGRLETAEDDDGGLSFIVDIVRAAIAKAEGTS